MIEIGDEFEVNGKVGIVCFKGNYFNQDYICLADDNEKTINLFKVKYDGDQYLFAEEKDEKKRGIVLGQFIADAAEGNEELKKMVDLVTESAEYDN